jgi:hypothetical protein
MNKMDQSRIEIATACDELKEMLLEKNQRYGDSALSPLRIFSKADATQALRVRLDDKLSRISNQQEDETEDTILDLLGYLVLLRIAQKRRQLETSGTAQ